MFQCELISMKNKANIKEYCLNCSLSCVEVLGSNFRKQFQKAILEAIANRNFGRQFPETTFSKRLKN